MTSPNFDEWLKTSGESWNRVSIGRQLEELVRRAIGRSDGYLTQLRNAAKVMHSVETPWPTKGFLADKAMHLYEISRAPRAVWELFAERLVKGYTVEKLADSGDIPEGVQLGATQRDKHTKWLTTASVVAIVETPEVVEPARKAVLDHNHAIRGLLVDLVNETVSHQPIDKTRRARHHTATWEAADRRHASHPTFWVCGR